MLNGDKNQLQFLISKILLIDVPLFQKEKKVAEDGDEHVGEEQLDANGLALWQHHTHHRVLDEAGLLAGAGATLFMLGLTIC